jgi:hypothetical protein
MYCQDMNNNEEFRAWAVKRLKQSDNVEARNDNRRKVVILKNVSEERAEELRKLYHYSFFVLAE